MAKNIVINKGIIKKAKQAFYKMLEKNDDTWDLATHLPEAEKWTNWVYKKYPSLDLEIIELSLWLHDIGHYPIIKGLDHAIVSEKIAKEFLEEEKYDPIKTKEVLHCVRSHRNRDITPTTLEAKLFSAIDSLSHFTYGPYLEATLDGRGEFALGKLERDFNDLRNFPEIQKELEPFYQAWKSLLIEYKKFGYFTSKSNPLS